MGVLWPPHIMEAVKLSPPSTTSSITTTTSAGGWRELTLTTPAIVAADAAHLKELAWVIPMVLGAVLAMVFIGLLCFYGVRNLERKMAGCCYNTFGCCRPQPSLIGSESDSLTLSKGVRMKEVKSYSSTSAYDVN